MPNSTIPQPADDIEDRDPGLARERTDLAWTRTAVAVWMLGQVSARNMHPATRQRRLSYRRTVQLITVVTTLISLLAGIFALTAPDGSR